MGTRKKFRRDIRRRLKEAAQNIEWALYHFAQIEADMKSVAGLGEDGQPLIQEELMQLPTIWQELVRDMRLIGSGLITAQEILSSYVERV
jgi:hypothetical protein